LLHSCQTSVFYASSVFPVGDLRSQLPFFLSWNRSRTTDPDSIFVAIPAHRRRGHLQRFALCSPADYSLPQLLTPENFPRGVARSLFFSSVDGQHARFLQFFLQMRYLKGRIGLLLFFCSPPPPMSFECSMVRGAGKNLGAVFVSLAWFTAPVRVVGSHRLALATVLFAMSRLLCPCGPFPLAVFLMEQLAPRFSLPVLQEVAGFCVPSFCYG